MFVALRDIRAARGRFALMTGVISLLTLLLVLLTGLTQGLGNQNTSAITALPADRVVFTPSTGGSVSYGDSTIDRGQAASWQDAPGITVEPLAIGHARLESAGAVTSIALFGADGAVAGELPTVPGTGIVLPAETADELGIGAGDTLAVNGLDLPVTALMETSWYSHSPVGYVDLSTYREVAHLADDTVGSVLLARTGTVSDDALAALDADAGTTALTIPDSLAALPSYTSENGSLLMIQGFLYGITALVTIAFLSVWTLQRTRDLAVLRALGAAPRYLLADTVGQSALLLAAGALLGGAIGTGAGVLLQQVAPFLLTATTIAVPVAGVAAIGLLGSVIATRRVTRIDPLLALGGS